MIWQLLVLGSWKPPARAVGDGMHLPAVTILTPTLRSWVRLPESPLDRPESCWNNLSLPFVHCSQPPGTVVSWGGLQLNRCVDWATQGPAPAPPGMALRSLYRPPTHAVLRQARRSASPSSSHARNGSQMATAVAHAAAATPLAASQSLLFQLEVRLVADAAILQEDAIFARYHIPAPGLCCVRAPAGVSASAARPIDQLAAYRVLWRSCGIASSPAPGRRRTRVQPVQLLSTSWSVLPRRVAGVHVPRAAYHMNQKANLRAASAHRGRACGCGDRHIKLASSRAFSRRTCPFTLPSR